MRQVHAPIETNHGVSYPVVGVGRFRQDRLGNADASEPLIEDDEVPITATTSTPPTLTTESNTSQKS
ncbi:hypothetical protein FYK55_13990 [Roseiconus nitratireducens]|uniref:Uncharacterized protein n=1 Tax=Roseiconus nitratireducens TaxID=2605748 RepID=A0A5M6D824_9BACT|nr:hypothetical protein [Roseiconus nitratireducens]KAA5542640.1 hypothetical protein FYK55_13990 [Roseiconus nitratireducens]